MNRFIDEPNRSVFPLPHQGGIEVWQKHPQGPYYMTLGWKQESLEWMLESITLPTAKREALVKLRRWFAVSIAEIDYELTAD